MISLTSHKSLGACGFRSKIRWLPPIAVAALMLLAGCGYRFSGTGELPEGVTSIGVRTLQNRTAEIGLENVLTNDLSLEMTRSGRVTVTRPEEASAVITGTITSLREGNISRTGISTSRQRRVTLSVEFVMSDREGEVLWRRVLSDSEEFLVAGDSFSTNANRRIALDEISRRLAEKAYYGMTDRF